MLPRSISALLALAALGFTSGCGTPSGSVVATPAIPLPTISREAYLFAHFTGESPRGEQIYFAVSEDGLKWTDLNNSHPVLLSNLGDKGVRDPSLLRTADGKKFILLATDLRIANGKGWDAARFHGSTSLVFWESTDLVNWSEPWMVDVASTIPGASCAWAPEAIYDEQTGDYFVSWATISPRDGVREARIYGARTKDFRTFTAPELYIERKGQGVGEGDIIDTQIIEVKGAKHRYYRSSRDSQITQEAADSIAGPWTRVGDLAHLGYTGRRVEGPILFQFNESQKWGLLVDQYAAGKGYLPLVSADLEDPLGFRVVPAADYTFGASRKRHGGILNITRAEYAALLAKWPSQPAQPPRRLAPLSAPDRSLRHAAFKSRLDAGAIRPAEDALWTLAPGLAGGEGENTVSLRAVNFPDHYLVRVANGLALATDDGKPDFAARATFVRTPGLADTSAVSFRVPGAEERYLRAQGSALIIGPAATEAERREATFLVRE